MLVNVPHALVVILVFTIFVMHPGAWLRSGQWPSAIAILQAFDILFLEDSCMRVSSWAQNLMHKMMGSLVCISWVSPGDPPSCPLSRKWVFHLATLLCISLECSLNTKWQEDRERKISSGSPLVHCRPTFSCQREGFPSSVFSDAATLEQKWRHFLTILPANSLCIIIDFGLHLSQDCEMQE